ncbi:MAG: flotillin family protein [Acidimicrobiales bacterium]|nr:flotillin family protein [Acidimicrobiales bacterium]
MLEFALAGGLALAAIAILVIFVVKSLIIICPPNRVAVISGRSRQMPDGRTVGYRAVKGGRTLRVPLLEQVSWMDLNNIPLEVSVLNAYSKGAIPLNVQGIANVKVSSQDALLSNSVERFLNVPHQAIAQIAKETLEANLRGVLATLTPEEVNEDRLKFSQVLIEEADDDIKTLGLELDVLKIQNVTDEVGYLDAVGRRRTAEVLKSARVSEAEKQAEAEQAEAASRQLAEIAQAQAELQIVEEQNMLRVRSAELDGVARASEEEAKIAGEKAKTIAAQTLEAERIELEKRRLQADVVLPAQAALEAKQLSARADAAHIVEEGAASVEVFKRLTEQYQTAGDDAHDILVLNMLPELIEKIVSTVNNIDIDKMTVIDSGGDGSALPGVVKQLPASVISIAEQIETATGVDIMGPLRNKMAEAGGGGGSGAAALPEASESAAEQVQVPEGELQTEA